VLGPTIRRSAFVYCLGWTFRTLTHRDSATFPRPLLAWGQGRGLGLKARPTAKVPETERGESPGPLDLDRRARCSYVSPEPLAQRRDRLLDASALSTSSRAPHMSWRLAFVPSGP